MRYQGVTDRICSSPADQEPPEWGEELAFELKLMEALNLTERILSPSTA
jgi:hypothetical protein